MFGVNLDLITRYLSFETALWCSCISNAIRRFRWCSTFIQPPPTRTITASRLGNFWNQNVETKNIITKSERTVHVSPRQLATAMYILLSVIVLLFHHSGLSAKRPTSENGYGFCHQAEKSLTLVLAAPSLALGIQGMYREYSLPVVSTIWPSGVSCWVLSSWHFSETAL